MYKLIWLFIKKNGICTEFKYLFCALFLGSNLRHYNGSFVKKKLKVMRYALLLIVIFFTIVTRIVAHIFLRRPRCSQVESIKLGESVLVASLCDNPKSF